MKKLIFQVSVGKPSVARYCKKYGITHKVLYEPKLKIVPDPNRNGRSKEAVARLGYMPIYEKENAFEYFDEYDQVAIVDSDIYIKPSAPDIFLDLPAEYEFGGVLEREMPLNKKYQNKIRKYSQSAFTNLKDVDWKWNTLGAEFYNFVDGMGFYKWSTDQMLLNWFVKKENVKCKNMNWKWNALYTAVDKNRMNESHFIHFFLRDKLPAKGENIEELLKKLI